MHAEKKLLHVETKSTGQKLVLSPAELSVGVIQSVVPIVRIAVKRSVMGLLVPVKLHVLCV